MALSSRLVAGGVVLTLLGGVGALALRRLDRTRPVTLDQAVDRYRASEPPLPLPAAPTATATPTPGARATAAPSPGTTATNGPGMTGRTRVPGGAAATSAPPATAEGPLQPPGVYVYDTTGYETADAGVHARHDYPARTTVTIRTVPCGTTVRWDATEDRWDEVTMCADGVATRVTAYRSYHRFFGQEERRDYTCGGTNWLRPPSPRAGLRWSFDCTAEGAKAHTDATLTGVETAGATKAWHVHYETTLTGSNRGTNPQDFWLALDGPYVVRQASRVDADVDTPFGSIRYHEEYDLRLTSRTPRR
ncbi:MAG TPA: hypothetical protein VFQ85_07915 [Mycobacteriales bacterium]|nr:hypothetical protein [Mycobacteriales bacterium]